MTKIWIPVLTVSFLYDGSLRLEVKEDDMEIDDLFIENQLKTSQIILNISITSFYCYTFLDAMRFYFGSMNTPYHIVIMFTGFSKKSYQVFQGSFL